MKLFLFLPVLFLAVACSSSRKMKKSERELVSIRAIQGVSKSKAIETARELLMLMDPADMKIQTTENGLIASRSWYLYQVVQASSGTDFWVVDVKEIDGGVSVSVIPTVRYGWADSEGTGERIQGTAIYDLFWKRFDYMLGSIDHWQSCDEEKALIKKGEVWGNLDHICDSITLADKTPAFRAADRLPATSK